MPLQKCKEELEKILAEHNFEKEALIPCLHAAQEKYGCLTEEVISFLAEGLKLPRVEVYSTASFYSMFTFEATGKYVIRVCESLPCYLKGSKQILDALSRELNIKPCQTTQDKKFTIEPVSCLGLCDRAPAMMINDEIYGNLTPEKVKEIIQELKKHAGER